MPREAASQPSKQHKAQAAGTGCTCLRSPGTWLQQEGFGAALPEAPGCLTTHPCQKHYRHMGFPWTQWSRWTLQGEPAEEAQRDPATPKPHLRGDIMFTAEMEEHLQKAQQPESQVRKFSSHEREP